MQLHTLSLILACAQFLVVDGIGTHFLSKNNTTKNKYGGRILQGDVADPINFPYMVRLHPRKEGLCGGTIISNKYIVTAGHCIWDDACTNMEIFPSTWKNGDAPLINVESCHPHDNYPGSGYYCDMGLIKTKEDLVDGLGLVRVNLPAPNQNFPSGNPAVIAGWGLNEEGYHPHYLKRADVRIFDWDGCNYDYQHAEACTDNGQCPVQEIPKRSMCTLGQGDNPPASCEGDSGGPVIIENILVGVISGTILDEQGKCVDGAPTLYMNVVRFLPWIHSYLELGAPPSDPSANNEPC